MLETLISSKTRVKILLKFFLNENQTAYLRGLEEEFNESTNSIRLELNKFENAGFLKSFAKGNKKIFQVNAKHPLFKDINSIVKKMVGIDYVIDYTLQKIGNLNRVYLVGDLSKGINSEIIDLVLVGDINAKYLTELIAKTEKKINKKIKFLIYSSKEFKLEKINDSSSMPLLVWGRA
ncbi:MAG: ArsR family transcriptional regulator [Bacteroidetes bacterium]|nr:ArsR family transcriptional regulator [Bacteroidota bacterium]